MHCDKMVLINCPLYEYNIQNDSISFDKAKQQKRRRDILEVVQKIKSITVDVDNNTQNAVRAFLLRSLSDGNASAEWRQCFYKAVGAPEPINNIKQEVKPTMQLGMLKIVRLFHLISKKKYNEKRQTELVKHSKLFDSKWYLANNPDVRSKKMSAAKHYVKHGWKEGRNPSQNFDGNAYILCGAKEGRCCYTLAGGGMSQPESDFACGCSMAQKVRDILNYPLWLQSECDRLKAEIAELKKTM